MSENPDVQLCQRSPVKVGLNFSRIISSCLLNEKCGGLKEPFQLTKTCKCNSTENR